MDALIAIIADEAYASAASALVRSIGATWQHSNSPTLRIIGPTWSPLRRSLIQQTAARAGCNLSFASVEIDTNLPIRSRWNRTIYSRLSLARTCGDANRVLCLDSDLIALRSLHRLFDQDLGQAPV